MNQSWTSVTNNLKFVEADSVMASNFPSTAIYIPFQNV